MFRVLIQSFLKVKLKKRERPREIDTLCTLIILGYDGRNRVRNSKLKATIKKDEPPKGRYVLCKDISEARNCVQGLKGVFIAS